MKRTNSFRLFDIFLIFGLFCIIYNPPIFSINSMHVIGLISWIILVFSAGTSKNIIPKYALKLILSFAIFAGYLFFISALFNHGTLYVFYTHIYFLIDIIPFGVVVRNYFVKKNRPYNDLFSILFTTTLIQSFIIVLAYIYSPFQQFLISRFVSYGYKSVYVSISRYRMYGFSGGLTFATPILHAFVSILMFYYAIKDKKKRYYLFSLLTLFSAIINARTSIVVAAVGIVCLTLFSRIELGKKIFLFFGECALVLLLYYLVPPILQSVSMESYLWVEDGINQIKSFFIGDTSEGYFSYILSSEQYPLPSSAVGILLGTGHDVFGSASQSLFGVSTDVGFINDLWKGGILYVLCYYIFIVSLFIRMIRKDNYLVSFMGLFSLFSYPLLMFKGSIFDMCDLTNFIVIVFVVSFDYELKKDKYERRRQFKSNGCCCALQ